MQSVLTMLESLIEVGESKQQLVVALAHLVQSLYSPDGPADNAIMMAINDQSVFGPLGWDV